MTVIVESLLSMSTTTLTYPSVAAADVRSSNRAVWLGFAVVIVSAVMDLLDSTIAQTAAPAIRRDLGGTYADLEWITAAYTLAMSAGVGRTSRAWPWCSASSARWAG
jgi:MFS family permease